MTFTEFGNTILVIYSILWLDSGILGRITINENISQCMDSVIYDLFLKGKQINRFLVIFTEFWHIFTDISIGNGYFKLLVNARS